jgi:ADP-ribose pyrophosphatase
VFAYLAIADLGEGQERIGGLDAEHEDIRTITLDFAALMDVIDSGEVENAPLLISAWWLRQNRDRLRARWGA